VPINCLTRPGEPVIGAWTTASVLRDQDEAKDGDDETLPMRQVSRLGNPLVNEVVIGLKDKDAFNATPPVDDAKFANYVLYPTLPPLVQALFGATAPATPRADLVQVFLTGVPGLNQPVSVKPSEMLRLNTTIAPKPAAAQDSLGVLAGDLAGFPNGRRPGD